MKEESTQQEVLLLTGTSFSARQRIENGESQRNLNLDETAELEEACWNGLLPAMLPEICAISDKPVFIWKIREGSAFLEVEISDVPRDLDAYYSLDPYAYMMTRIFS
jgi:hypothetical protein